jgi:hypothetical protein
MFARIDVVTAEKDRAQLVPNAAVIERGGGSGLFVIPEGGTVARYENVRTGIVSSLSTEILAPEIRGMVVTLGQHLLDDGSPITLSGDPGGGPLRADSIGGEKGAE